MTPFKRETSQKCRVLACSEPVLDDSLPTMSIVAKSLSPDAQSALLAEVAACVKHAPFFRPVLPRWGTPFSVQMSNAGPLGWVSDKSGYRYETCHPVTGKSWPPIPDMLLDLWAELTDYPAPPEACLINHYTPQARMGLHQDKDEKDFSAPVLSVSLGDDARFKLGGLERKGPTESTILKSGDVMLLSGETRLAFHGVDRIYAETSQLLAPNPDLFPGGGRINLTLRRVTKSGPGDD